MQGWTDSDWPGPALVVGVGLASWLYLLARFGRGPSLRTRRERVTSPPQDWHPNLVRYLLSWGEIVSASLAVFDLVRRGILEVVVEGEYEEGKPAPHRPEDYSLVWRQRPDDALADSDRQLLSTILFYREQGNRANLEEVRQVARSGRGDAEHRLEAWQRSAQAECAAAGLVEPPSRHLRCGGLVIGLALVAYGIANLATSEIAAFLPFMVGLAIGLGSLLIRRHTPEGARARQQWDGFGRYLSQFAERKLSPPDISKCECYLNFADALVVDGAAQRQFSSLHGDRGETGLAFLNWRFANGAGMGSASTALEIRKGFERALHSVWEMHAVPRSD
jgi:YD repeat-containing protein